MRFLLRGRNVSAAVQVSPGGSSLADAIFFISQFFQTVQGLSPFQSGLRDPAVDGDAMLVAPIAGAVSDRIGGHRLMGARLALQAIGLAWIAAVSTPTTAYVEFIAPFLISGVGMALFFAPVAHVVLSSVRPELDALPGRSADDELAGLMPTIFERVA